MLRRVKRGRRTLTRRDFELEFAKARNEKRAPQISGFAAGVDLSNLDFSSPYTSPYGSHSGVFIGIDLRNANLSGSRLTSSDLSSANLRGANFANADLRGANLYSCLLQGANLRGASLAGANLISAELCELMIGDADFTDSRFGTTGRGTGMGSAGRTRQRRIDCAGPDSAVELEVAHPRLEN